MLDNSAGLINQLRATLGKMEVALGAIVEAIVWTDNLGRVHWSNATFDRLVNQQRFQVLGESLLKLLPLEQQGENIPSELHPLSMILRGQRNVNGVYEFQQADKRLVLEISSTRIEFKGQEACAVFVIRDITQAQKATERQAIQFAVTRILTESSTLSEAIPKLLEAICHGTGWEVGAMWQVDTNANLLRCEATFHNPKLEAADFENITCQTTFTSGIGLPGRVWASGQPAWLTHIGTDSNFPRAPVAAETRLHGAFAFPILNDRTQVTGVMEFFSRHPKEPDEDLLRVMIDIGSQINQFASRRRAEASLYKEQKFLNAVLNGVETGIIACDSEGLITVFNRAVLNFHGVSSPPKTVTQWLEEYDFYFSGSKTKINSEENPLLQPLLGKQISNLEIIIVPQAGTTRTFLASVQPIFDANVKNLGAVLALHDITERKIAETERAQLLTEQAARSEAEAANRMKDDFLATLSHELRTPLNAMRGWTTLLRTRKFDEATTSRALETIERNTKLLAQLIEDVLDVSRITTGKLHLNVHPCKLVPIIEAAIDTVRPMVEAKNIHIDALLDPTVGLVRGEAHRLQQVVWNLLSNAVKFTPNGGRVEVKLFQQNFNAQIQVNDTGVGINPDFLPYVFDRFRQENSTTTRAHGGLGLGLAIVRHLVELMGGTVGAESLGAGKGATFIVNLPLVTVDQTTSANQSEQPTLTDAEPTIIAPSLDGIKVLVVDDEADARELLMTMLGQYGADVTAVATAQEALQALPQLNPNVLVSDIGMPFEDGYTLIRKVRAMDAEQGGCIPAVALTAYASTSDRTQALLAGFQIHVPKPANAIELAVVVGQLTGRSVSAR